MRQLETSELTHVTGGGAPFNWTEFGIITAEFTVIGAVVGTIAGTIISPTAGGVFGGMLTGAMLFGGIAAIEDAADQLLQPTYVVVYY
ncbi:MAG: hypothetical protein V4490_08460 [Pseudomonadota bacterium]